MTNASLGTAVALQISGKRRSTQAVGKIKQKVEKVIDKVNDALS